MDLCEHAYYSEREKYFPVLYCKLRGESGRCIYSKRCIKLERFSPLENEMWRACAEYNMEKAKNIPVGSYYVQTTRPNKQGKLFLYVLVQENKIERILSNFTKLDQDYIYLKKNSSNGYEISLTPIADVEVETIPQEEIVETNTVEEIKEETNNIEPIKSVPVKKSNRGRKKKEVID